MTEFESLIQQGKLKSARFGSFLVIPLKYSPNGTDEKAIGKYFDVFPLTTADISEPVKDIFNTKSSINAGTVYKMKGNVNADILGIASCDKPIKVCDKSSASICDEGAPEVIFASAYLAVFNTTVAFLALEIRYDQMQIPALICNPGYSELAARFFYKDGEALVEADINKQIEKFCGSIGFEKFFTKSESLFLDAYTYNLAVTECRFQQLETMRQLTFNLHLMVPLDFAAEDESEDDIRYVYSVKAQEKGSYRWGSCITSQTISYIVANESLDIDEEMAAQAADGLPLVFIALYQKYTCLRFTELLTQNAISANRIKRMMFEFKAYGCINPSNISRWNNVKQLYYHIIETNGVTEAIEDIDTKIALITENQREKSESRTNALAWILSVFGIISIVASILTVVQVLQGGDATVWIWAILSLVIITVSIVVALVVQRKRD